MRLPFSRKRLRSVSVMMHTVPVRDRGESRDEEVEPAESSSPVTVFHQKSKGKMVRCLIPGT